MKRKEVSIYVAAIAIFFATLAPNLPDTSDRSPRTIAYSIGISLTAMALVLRGKDK